MQESGARALDGSAIAKRPAAPGLHYREDVLDPVAAVADHQTFSVPQLAELRGGSLECVTDQIRLLVRSARQQQVVPAAEGLRGARNRPQGSADA